MLTMRTTSDKSAFEPPCPQPSNTRPPTSRAGQKSRPARPHRSAGSGLETPLVLCVHGLTPKVNTTRRSKMSELSGRNTVVAVYDTHAGAEEAVKELSRAGVDMRTLPIVGKDSHTEEQAVAFYKRGERMKCWGTPGAFWGGLWGLLSGWAVLAIRSLAGLLSAGAVVAW